MNTNTARRLPDTGNATRDMVRDIAVNAAISGVSRLAGETRYDTALKAANEIKSSGDRKILRHHRCLRRKLCRFAVSLRCGASHPAGEYGK